MKFHSSSSACNDPSPVRCSQFLPVSVSPIYPTAAAVSCFFMDFVGRKKNFRALNKHFLRNAQFSQSKYVFQQFIAWYLIVVFQRLFLLADLECRFKLETFLTNACNLENHSNREINNLSRNENKQRWKTWPVIEAKTQLQWQMFIN